MFEIFEKMRHIRENYELHLHYDQQKIKLIDILNFFFNLSFSGESSFVSGLIKKLTKSRKKKHACCSPEVLVVIKISCIGSKPFRFFGPFLCFCGIFAVTEFPMWIILTFFTNLRRRKILLLFLISSGFITQNYRNHNFFSNF